VRSCRACQPSSRPISSLEATTRAGSPGPPRLARGDGVQAGHLPDHIEHLQDRRALAAADVEDQFGRGVLLQPADGRDVHVGDV
jgi:hypothetical protein